MTFPPDYYERVYAGILGKIIGVYLGRPFEGWTYEQITAHFGFWSRPDYPDGLLAPSGRLQKPK